VDIRSLQLYLAVLEHGSITKAAERSHVTQPALGLHIRKLEHQFGVQLVQRHSRGITATEAGEKFAVHARAIIDRMKLAEAEMTQFAATPSGEIIVGMTPSVRETIADQLLERVSKNLQGVRLIIKEALSEVLVKHLMASRIDVALVYNTREGGDQLTFTPLAMERMYFVYPANEPVDGGETITAREAFGHRLILPTRNHNVRTEIERVAEKLGMSPELSHEVDSVPAIRSFIAHGLGCSMMPRPPQWDTKVAARLVVEPEIRRILHLAHLRQRPVSRAFEAVQEAITQMVEAERQRPEGQWRPLESPTLG
jgi:LysR family nitrogen assimilation transcriptional regulator